ncbi:MAG: hypothetical protein JSW40_07790 [Candidatus Omnitrophota bacterium]|nr:MAG: hypothetical protein JSW40_07790 [Candidatus Omnitrophota bacterium]
MFNFRIRIADKIMRFKTNSSLLAYNASKAKEFRHFLYSEKKRQDCTFDIKYGGIPELGEKELLFRIGEGWSLSKCADKILFEYPDRNIPNRTAMIAEIKSDMTEGKIYVNAESPSQDKEETGRPPVLKMTGNHPAPILAQSVPKHRLSRKRTPQKRGQEVMIEIKANFFQAFFVEYLARQRVGLLAHCASVQHRNKLYLFMGKKETGKSTIAHIWHDAVGATVFNDDRGVIAVKNRTPYFYNAPWVGTLVDKCDLHSGYPLKIEKIFFIYQSPENALRKISRQEAIPKIFRNSFPVFWNKNAAQFALGICSQIAHTTPCYDFGFVNNESIVTFLKRKLDL